MPSPTGFVSMNVKREVRDVVQAGKYELTGAAGQNVTLSDAIAAAFTVARKNPDEWVRALNDAP